MAEVKDFTPREMEIMAKAWNCFVEEPKVRPTILSLTTCPCIAHADRMHA